MSRDRLGALGHVTTEQTGRTVMVYPRDAPTSSAVAAPWPDEGQ